MKKGVILSSLILNAVLLTSCNTSSPAKTTADSAKPRTIQTSLLITMMRSSKKFPSVRHSEHRKDGSGIFSPVQMINLTERIPFLKKYLFSKTESSPSLIIPCFPMQRQILKKHLETIQKMTDDEIVSYLNPYIEKNRTEGQKYLDRMLKGFEYMETEGQKPGGIKAASAGDRMLHFIPSKT